jgi:hypothetical protein
LRLASPRAASVIFRKTLPPGLKGRLFNAANELSPVRQPQQLMDRRRYLVREIV